MGQRIRVFYDGRIRREVLGVIQVVEMREMASIAKKRGMISITFLVLVVFICEPRQRRV